MNERFGEKPLDRLVLTAADQRAVDAAAVAAGVPSSELMESAGRAAADWILAHLDPANVLVIAGPGGNGGDGLVVARRLFEAGVGVGALLLADPERMNPTSREMLDRLPENVKVSRDLLVLDEGLASADCVVDALFGTGLSRPLAGVHQEAVDRVNVSKARIISLDLPSGLPSDTGELLGPSIRASITLAMAFLKPAHLKFPAARSCGNVAVLPVAYPADVLQVIEPQARVCELAGIAARLPDRSPTGHKGTFGRVLVLAGSRTMAGAAVLTCRAVVRAGAGLVFLAAPQGVRDRLKGAVPEAITIPMPEVGGELAGIGDDGFRERLDQIDVLVAGPGLGRRVATARAIREAVAAFDGPIVLDADAVHAFSGHLEALTRAGARVLITPHAGEFSAIAGVPIEEATDEAALAFACRIGVHVLLKGRPTAIATPDGRLWLNPTGNSGLATGGSGDVLTGIIGGLVAGGATLESAAIAAAYLHGRTAEVFAAERSSRSLMPSDIIELLPYVIREAEGQAE